MWKLKVLVPLDGTETSLYALHWIKKFFPPSMIDITLINVIEGLYARNSCSVGEFEINLRKSMNILLQGEYELPEYTVEKASAFGSPSEVILKEAEAGGYHMIVITKSNIKGLIKFVGAVTTKIIRNSDIPVISVSECKP
ncbi:MAG: universal stress protein [Solirubrobacterales bacterium]